LQTGTDLQKKILKERTVVTSTFSEVFSVFNLDPNFMIDVYKEYLDTDILDACTVEQIPNLHYPTYLAIAVQLNSQYAEILNYQ
jgi:hypothetical protein